MTEVQSDLFLLINYEAKSPDCMPPETQPQIKPVVGVDDEYKDAIQPVVDDRMRTDILGPHFCRVLKDHKPASEDIVALVAEEAIADPKLKKAIKDVVDERNRETKMQWFNRALGVMGTILLALAIWGIQELLKR